MQQRQTNALKVIAFSCVLLGTWSAAQADDKVELVSDAYVESFIPNAKVSGGLLVGVKWADSAGAFSPAKVSIRVPKEAQGHKACVEINSQDGRYTAQNLYMIKADPGQPARFETKTAFAQNLSQYNTSAMAVNVRLVDACDSPEVGPLVPASLDEPAKAGPSRKLLVLMNAEPHKLALRLLDHGKEVGHFNGCSAVGSSVNVAFTSSCEIALDQVAGGAYDLEAKVNERFDHVTKHFTLLFD